MRKHLLPFKIFVAVFIASTLLGINTANAAGVPTMTYATPNVYTVGTPATLNPTLGGGAVSAFGYNTSTVASYATGVNPNNMIFDAAGNLYVTNGTSNTVSKVTPGGTITTFINTNLNSPQSIAFDASGNAYVANINSITKYSSTGVYLGTIVAGGNLSGIDIDASGNIWVADLTAGLREYSSTGTLLQTITTNITGASDVFIDNLGFIYVTSSTSSTTAYVSKYSSTGAFISKIVPNGLDQPYSVYVDGAGNIYVANSFANNVKIFNSAGTQIGATFTGNGNTTNEASGIITDAAGNMYVASATNNTVTKFAPKGGYFISGYLPAGLTFDTATGQITGTPTTPTAAVSYTVTAYNASGLGTSNTFTIAVNPSAPNVVVTTLPATCGGGSTKFTASGGSPAGGTYNWYTSAAGGVPAQSSAATTYTTNLYSATTLYVSYTYNGQESARTAIAANIKDFPFTTQVTAYGLSYSYPFTNGSNLADASGSGNTAAAQPGASPTTDRFGVANNAYNLNGSTGFISTLNNITAPSIFTINMWFNTTTAGGALAGFNNSQTGTGTTYDRSIYLNSSGDIVFGTYNGGFQTIQSASAYNDGNWHMVTASIASDGMKLYVDGTLVASNTAYTSPQANTGYWRFGEQTLSGWPGAVSNYFTGQIDDIDIYSRELTANEVNSLQGAEVSPICSGGTLSFSANPAVAAGATYSWTGPGFATPSTLQNPIIPNATTAATGNYTVVVTGSDGCSSTQTIYGLVNPLPDASFTAPNNTVVNTNTVFTLVTAFNNGLYTYSYTDGDGSNFPIAGNNFTIKWPTIGPKTVSLTVTNISTGCTSTYSVALNVSLSVTTANYAFSQPVTLNSNASGIASTLTNFPALVYIKEDALKASTPIQNCANNIQFPSGGLNGYDFAFTLNGSNTELFYQVQSYDPVTGTLLAWVQIPSVSGSSNVSLTFYFGSTTPNHTNIFTRSTWPTDYLAVYHFDENSTSATVLDATIASTNATQTNTTVATGQIGKAYSFNGTSTQIISTSTNNNVTGSFTLSAWVNSASFVGHTDQKVMTNETSLSTGGYKLSLYGGSSGTVMDEVETRPNSGNPASLDRAATGGTALFPNTWYYVQGVYDASTGTFYSYLNGAKDRSMTGAVGAGTNGGAIIMGSDYGANYWFNGIIDECRISTVAKSADWIKEEYYNQSNQLTYTTCGTAITTNVPNATALGNPGGAIVYTWTGATDTNPLTATNWTSSASGAPTGVPPFDGTCSLNIPTLMPRYPVLTANESVYGLTLGAGATINLNGYTLNVGCHIYNNAAGASQIIYGSNTGTITFNGSMPTQYFYGNGATTTSNVANLILNNTAAGTLDITGGNVNLYNSLTITKGNILVDNAGSGSLTLISQASGTANVNTIPSPYTIQGNVIAQRYIPGGAGYRSYRLITLPVNINSSVSQAGSPAYIDLSSLNGGVLTAGPGTGFSYGTATKNPLMYLYDESRPQNFSAYVAGKNVGIYAMTGSPTYKVTYYGAGVTPPTVPATTLQVPVGNSVQVYYVGPNTAPNLTATTPLASTASATGYINQGMIPIRIFTPGNAAGSPNLSYNPAINNTPAKGPGLNQVGNPYPSTIDLDSLYFDNKAGGSNIGPSFWELKEPNNTFVAYNASTHLASSAGAEAYIAGGQGFYTQALSNSSTLTFNENQKVNVTIGTATPTVLLLSQRQSNPISAAEILPSGIAGLHLQIAKDTSTYTQTGIFFNSNWSDSYTPREDAIDLDGTAPKVYLSSYSKDGARLCLNELGSYANRKVVKLYASAISSGTYTITLADIKNIDTLYNVYLRDHKLNDSVELRKTNAYSFEVNTSDTTTFGANRFDIVIEKEAVQPYKLLTFTGQKISSGVQLNWVANNPGSYTSFILQKLDNNNNFNSIYTIQSNNSSNYNFVDNNPFVGNNIYRLAQNDINGNIVYSSLVTIGYNNVTSNGYFSVYPNPSKDIINILVNSTTPNAVNYTADIYNTSGELMDHRVLNTYRWSEDISSYKEGVYIIALKNINGDVLAKSKFIKTK